MSASPAAVMARALVLACVVLGGVVSSAWAAQPSISTSASGPVVVGGQVYDTAALSGGAAPTGTVTFRLYWPGDTSCTHTPAFSSTVATAGGAVSSSFSTMVAGMYRWTASYGGDANNSPATGACNAPNESVSVLKASPTLTSSTSGTVSLGSQISDTATLNGRFTGSVPPCEIFTLPGAVCVNSPLPGPVIRFALFGPDNAGCTGAPVFTAMRFGDTGVSAPFTPTVPGTYRWTTSYPGEDNNNAATGACNAPNESVLVTPSSAPAAGTPSLTALSIAPASFRVAGSGASVASVIGSRVSYSLSEGASVTFRVERPLVGRRVGGRCVRPRRSNRGARRCTRFVTLGSFTHKGQPGPNTFRFTGRLRGRKLAPGPYRLRGEATAPAGGTSRLRRIAFRIVSR